MRGSRPGGGGGHRNGGFLSLAGRFRFGAGGNHCSGPPDQPTAARAPTKSLARQRPHDAVFCRVNGLLSLTRWADPSASCPRHPRELGWIALARAGCQLHVRWLRSRPTPDKHQEHEEKRKRAALHHSLRHRSTPARPTRPVDRKRIGGQRRKTKRGSASGGADGQRSRAKLTDGVRTPRSEMIRETTLAGV